MSPGRRRELELTGAVLVGGASRRMGADKATLDVDGIPMANRVATALAAAGCTEVVVVGGDRASLERLGHRHVDDAPEFVGTGPVAGVIAALADARTRGADAVVVAACDLPDLDAGAVSALVAASTAAAVGSDGPPGEPTPTVAATRTTDGRLQRHPACALWPVSQFEALCAHVSLPQSRRSLHAALDAIGAVDVELESHALLNANTPADVAGRSTA